MIEEGSNYNTLLAEDIDNTQMVAIKTTREPISSSRSVLGDLKREALSLLFLAHPAVPKLRCFGVTAHGSAALVSEYVRGITLHELTVNFAGLSPSLALRLIYRVLEALSVVHQCGFIHGDLSPSNVLVTSLLEHREQVALIDFSPPVLPHAWGIQDESGSCLRGTPGYVAPEVISGVLDLDPRVDLYACGVILYELLCGNLPIAGSNPFDLLANTIREAPHRLSRPIFLPQKLWHVLAQALSPRREDRFDSTKAFRQALASACASS